MSRHCGHNLGNCDHEVRTPFLDGLQHFVGIACESNAVLFILQNGGDNNMKRQLCLMKCFTP